MVRRMLSDSSSTSRLTNQETMVPWIRWVTSLLLDVQKSIHAMTTSFQKMSQKCDAYIFYHRVRPFLSGTKGKIIILDDYYFYIYETTLTIDFYVTFG